MSKPMRIFVIGHMGVGKFLFSEALAKALNWPLIVLAPFKNRHKFVRK